MIEPQSSRPGDGESPQRHGSAGAWQVLRAHWPVLTGAVLAALPAALAVGRDVWTTEQGAHGPIILVTGLWLLWRETPRDAAPLAGPGAGHPGAGHPGAGLGARLVAGLIIAAMVPAGLVSVFAAIIGKVWLQAAGTYALLVLVYALCAGPAALRRAWFAIVYLGFLVPPPPPVIVPATRALKLAIADGAAQMLALAGYNATSLGAYLYIDSYELVVAAACAGLNSLTSLLAVGLLYAFLRHRAEPLPLAILALAALPVAIAANFLRVVILLLVTHYAGSGAAQGLLHDAAGLSTFTLALAVMMAIDMLIGALWHPRAGGGAAARSIAPGPRAAQPPRPITPGAGQ